MVLPSLESQIESRSVMYLTLCDPTHWGLPGSSVHGILQARVLEWVAMPSSRGPSQPTDQPASLMSPELARRFFITKALTYSFIKQE